MIKNVVGTPVRGNDLFGRSNFIELVWEKLSLTNVLLVAPRRFGKTSIMYNMLDTPRTGYKVLHIDLQPVTEPVDFVVVLLEKLKHDKKLSNALKKSVESTRKFFESIEVGVDIGEEVQLKVGLKEQLKKKWQRVGNEILQTLEHTDDKIIIILDEFAMMIENFLDKRLEENEVREFLSWFRQIRIAPDNTRVRFLIGSSISVDHHLTRLGVLSAFNDFERLVLRELDETSATQFVDQLFEGKRHHVPRTVKKKILELVGPPIPYFIQIMVSEICKIISLQEKRISIHDVEQLYLDTVLGVNCKEYFELYYARLKYYDTINGRAAKALLRHLAIAGEVTKKELYQQYLKETQQPSNAEGFNNLMSDLENDFYITFSVEREGYVFFSKILRDWWRRYYSL